MVIEKLPLKCARNHTSSQTSITRFFAKRRKIESEPIDTDVAVPPLGVSDTIKPSSDPCPSSEPELAHIAAPVPVPLSDESHDQNSSRQDVLERDPGLRIAQRIRLQHKESSIRVCCIGPYQPKDCSYPTDPTLKRRFSQSGSKDTGGYST